MPEPRSFADRPRPGYTHVGTETEFGEKIGWKDYPQEGREEATTFPRPPTVGKGYMTPDYSNRSLFEKHVFREIGGDPIKLNPRDALSVVDENLPEIFEQFFGGRVVWEDRSRLTKEQGAAWDEVIRSYHAMVLKDAEMKKAVMVDRYNFMMNQFDNAAKEYQNALTRVRARREKVATIRRTQEKATAKAGEVSPIDVKRYSDMLRGAEKDMQKGSIQQAQIDALNMVARKIGAPEMTIEETELDPMWIERAWNFVNRQETIQKEVELKKKKAEIPAKPTVKEKPIAKKKVKPGRTLDPKNKTDRALAKRLLKKAGGDIQKARQLAKDMGYSF